MAVEYNYKSKKQCDGSKNLKAAQDRAREEREKFQEEDTEISFDFDLKAPPPSQEKSEEEQAAENALEIQRKKEIEYQGKLDSFMEMVGSNDVWGYGKLGMKSLQAAMQMISMKTGMYARIPIYCKGKNCPYAESCPLLRYGIQSAGEACAVEVAYIQRAQAEYYEEFGLDASTISRTDRTLVDEIIRMEILMERCMGLMSKELSPVQMMTVSVDEEGNPIQAPSVSKAVEAYERFSKKRNEDYQLMKATRKDKKNTTDNKEKDYMELIEEMGEKFYEIEQRPDYIEGVD